MVNRVVREKLLKQLGISHQALSKQAKRLKKLHGPMSTEEAVYVIAHTSGIDLSRALPLATLDRIRSLIPRELPPAASPAVPPTKKQTRARNNSPSYPLVSKQTVAIALRLGSEVFPSVFVLENSIRALVRSRLSREGTDWWARLVPTDVKNSVARTMNNERKYPYRRPRGGHELLYANFADLKKIILHNPGLFGDILAKPDWFSAGMDDVYMARNNLAHSIALESSDISHILTFSSEWATLTEKISI